MNKIPIKLKTYYYAALFIAGCFFVYSCENDQSAIDEWTKDKLMQEEATDIVSYYSQGGKVKAELTAPVMFRVMAADTQYVEFPKSLHVDFYNDSATAVKTRLDAKYGKYFEEFRKVYLRDSVIVITINGDTLRSPDLWWDQNRGLFYTDNYAEYHSKSQIIHGGKGLEATDDLKTVTFKEPTGIVDIKGEGVE